MLSQQLQVFLQVVDCGSFSKAAKKLFVTPASVMKHVNGLEKRLGVVLLRRSNRGIELTPAGTALYDGGKKMAAYADQILAGTKAAGKAEGIVVRVGSSLLNPGKVLTAIWEPLRTEHPEYTFRIVPYEDTKEEIISLISSLGENIDVLVGSFNSRTMLAQANYLPLGEHRLCIAVPKRHTLAKRKALTLTDLYGERLAMVKSGDTEVLDEFRAMLQQNHRQIQIEETGYYYDADTFNACEREGCLLLTLDVWADVHPSLVTLPIQLDYTVSYGILYARNPEEKIRNFIEIIRKNCCP